MSSGEEAREDLLRRFEEAISGAELDDLRQLGADLSLLGAAVRREPIRQRPELRRPRLPSVRVFRVRADLKRSRPPIWRRLELRSDLTLDVAHRVLQASFGWTDSHLWRFSLGDEPLGRSGQSFLCPWDVEEREEEDDGAPAACDVRLDEVIQAPGDMLFYLYDYGDTWELTLRLEEVSATDARPPAAVLIDGRRAGPPEDCGGLTSGAELAEVLEDPARFDIDETNTLLRSPYVGLAEADLDRRLLLLLDRLAYGPLGEEVERRVGALLAEPEPPDPQALEAALAAFQWFLNRAAEGDIGLTAAGYLKPVDVTAAARVVPAMAGWIGKHNREIETTPVLVFRELMQSLGLLQKRKGVLRLTRAGHTTRQSPEALWDHVAGRLVPTKERFHTEASLLLLAFAASSPGEALAFEHVAAALSELGWHTEGGEPVNPHDLYRLRAVEVLRNVGEGSDSWIDRWRISPPAAKLARAGLRRR